MFDHAIHLGYACACPYYILTPLDSYLCVYDVRMYVCMRVNAFDAILIFFWLDALCQQRFTRSIIWDAMLRYNLLHIFIAYSRYHREPLYSYGKSSLPPLIENDIKENIQTTSYLILGIWKHSACYEIARIWQRTC